MPVKRCWLMIDDDPDDREIFGLAVEEAVPGVRLVTKENGVQGLSWLKSRKAADSPHLIFVDLNMPVMDGREFLHELRRLPAYRSSHVIVYTTANEEFERSALRGKATEFVTKPSDISELIKVLKELGEKYPWNGNPG